MAMQLVQEIVNNTPLCQLQSFWEDSLTSYKFFFKRQIFLLTAYFPYNCFWVLEFPSPSMKFLGQILIFMMVIVSIVWQLKGGRNQNVYLWYFIFDAQVYFSNISALSSYTF